MKANEFRIGNLVVVNDIIYKVLGIDEDSLMVEPTIDFEHLISMERTNRFQPIQLTEEWVLKFGFKEIKRYSHDFEEIIYSKSIIVGSENHCEGLLISMPFKVGFIGDYLSDEEYTLNIDINNVHQLQNLYFALTNEELKITL
jgi:hypothetical protein